MLSGTFLVVLCLVPSYIQCQKNHISDGFSIFPSLAPWVGADLPPDGEYAECVRDSRLLRDSLANGTLWAARMLDASEGRVTGALWGARFHLGSFDGCLSTSSVSPVGAQYCLVNISLHSQPVKHGRSSRWSHVEELDPYEDVQIALQGLHQAPGHPRMGEVLSALCVPRSCSAPALQAALRARLATATALISVDPQRCTTEQDLQHDSVIIKLFWFFIAALTCTALVAPYLGWSSWDWRRHVNALTAPDATTGGINWAPLSGIRFINTILVVVAHRPGVDVSSGSQSNQAARDSNLTSLMLAPVLHGQLFVDTFLCMSGMLFVLTSNQRSPIKSTLSRLSRLTPLYALLVFLMVFISPSMSSGPLWKHRITQENEACRKWGWTNLLYINNYVGGGLGERGCMVFTWTMAVDMQLFLLSLLLLPYLRRGAALVLPLLFVTVLIPFLNAYWFELPAVMNWTPKAIENVFNDPMWVFFYTPTHMRASVYVVGLALGMVVYKFKVTGTRLSKLATWITTAGSLMVMLVTLLSSVLVMDPVHPVSTLQAALYHSLCPVLWAVTVGCLIIALLFGEDTSVRSFLSLQPLITMSRLTFGVYMVSMMLQFFIVTSQKDATSLSITNAITSGLSDLVMAFAISFWLYIIVEAPCRTMFKERVLQRYGSPVPEISLKPSQNLENDLSASNNNISEEKKKS